MPPGQDVLLLAAAGGCCCETSRAGQMLHERSSSGPTPVADRPSPLPLPLPRACQATAPRPHALLLLSLLASWVPSADADGVRKGGGAGGVEGGGVEGGGAMGLTTGGPLSVSAWCLRPYMAARGLGVHER